MIAPSRVSHVVFSLGSHPDADAYSALRRDVAAAIAAGGTSIVIDVDDLGILDAPVISTLVGILRESRAAGATVALRTARERVLETLRVTALDRVFTVVTGRDRAGAGRVVAAFAAGFFAIATVLGARASAQGDESPSDLVQRVVGQNGTMQSYQAKVAVDFKLRSFPYISQHLDGTTYYKRPDNFEVVFDKVPSYAKGFDKLYSDIDDPTSWASRFDFFPAGERVVGDHRDVVIRLVQKVRGQIDHEDVAIDPVRARIDTMTWHYYNGGTISMNQEFERVGEFTVLSKQHATIHIPFVHASAEAVYRNYKTNVAIDDSVFTGKKHE